MGKIDCSVESCSYNKSGICSARILNIGGGRSKITETTFCETYLKRSEYSNAAEYEESAGNTEEILCEVETCAYHARQHCTLKEIEVGSLKEVDDYTETDCLSFDRK